jgi:anti-sigma factor RsiW
MFSQHESRNLSAYCHGELSEEDSRRVAEHLMGCTRCRREFEEVKLGVKLAEQLPRVSAPASLWNDIEAALSESTGTGRASQAALLKLLRRTDSRRPPHQTSPQRIIRPQLKILPQLITAHRPFSRAIVAKSGKLCP